MFLSLRLPQPLLLEGEAGVGKTEAAKALARVLDTPLIRLQCYEGIDAAEALYEWNYPRQLLAHPARRGERRRSSARRSCSGREYLIRRPLLRALEHPGPRPGGAADRRDRPRRRRLRGVPARAARGGERDDPGDRHGPRHPSAGHRADLEPHARPARRGQAPLPLSLDRLPDARARGGDRPPPRQGRVGDARRAGRERGLADARRATCRSRPGSPRRSTGSRR